MIDGCDRPSSLFLDVPEVLADAKHPCHAWVEAVHRRVFRQTLDSAVLWSRRTKHETGVLVTAMHTLGGGWFGPGGEPIKQELFDPTTQDEGVPRLFAPDAKGSFASAASALWPLYVPAVPGDETRGKLEDILPRHDFVLAAVDGQTFTTPHPGLAPAAGKIQTRKLELDDANRATTATPTFAAAKAGDVVMLVGVPKGHVVAFASVARVLDAREVAAAQDFLRKANDEEGSIAYDPEAELFLEGHGVGGMSGGGAFDREGNLVGVIVRGSIEKGPNGVPYTRVVRMPFIVAQVRAAVAALPAPKRAAIELWLGDLE